MTDKYQPKDPQAAAIVRQMDEIINSSTKSLVNAHMDNTTAKEQATRRLAENAAKSNDGTPRKVWKAGTGKAGL